MIAFACSASAAHAQTADTVPEFNDSFLPRLQRATSVLSRDTVDIPLEDSRGHPFVRVMLDGRGPFRLGVETGAPVLVLSRRVAETLGNPHVDAVGNVVVDSLTAGDARFDRVAALVTEGDLGDLDGLLGLSVYYDLLTTLDLGHHRMRFVRGTLPAATDDDVLALETIMNQVYGVPIFVNGVRHIAALDTQNEGAFLVPPSNVADTQFIAPPVLTGLASGAGIGLQENKMGRFAGAIRLGPITFHQPIVDVIPVPYAGLQGWNVGWRALQRAAMTLDQRTRRVRLASSIPSVSPPPPDSGFVTILVDSNGTIQRLVPEKNAATDGLQIGDTIVSYDGKPFSRPPFGLFRTRHAVRVVVRRGAQTKTARLIKHLRVR